MAAGVAAACLTGTAVSASPRAVPPATASFATFPIPSSLPGANFAGEPSIGINRQTNDVLYQAGLSTLRFRPSNAEWSDVSSPYTGFNIDPILATDPTTGLTFAGGDDGSCSILAVTSDEGKTWSPSLPCTFTSDHPTVGIGPVVGSSPQASERVVYFCEQYPLAGECTTSRDDGLTWLPAVPVRGGCFGVFGHIKFGQDGTAYLPYRTCFLTNDLLGIGHVGVAVSTDNGRNWNSFRMPDAVTPRGFDPSIATTPDNTVYETWGRDPDLKPVISWSHDHGQSWSTPVDISKGSPYPIYAAAFPAAVAGDNGRVAVAYLGADRSAGGKQTPYDAGYVGAWYLYVSATYDGGKHWTTTRVQNAPVQLGQICDTGTRCLHGRNLLDFIDANLTSDGRLVVGYDNGCQGGCPSDVTQQAKSVGSWGIIAVQIGGQSLFTGVPFRPL